MSMWTSFGAAGPLSGRKVALDESGSPAESSETPREEIDELKTQLAAMQQRLERLAKDRD
jgi:polyhydroxyalkanoate synthesis regulator protein